MCVSVCLFLSLNLSTSRFLSTSLNLPLFVSVRGGEDAWQATPSLLHFQLTLDISLNLLGGVPVWINGDEYRQDAVLSFLLGYKHS